MKNIKGFFLLGAGFILACIIAFELTSAKRDEAPRQTVSKLEPPQAPELSSPPAPSIQSGATADLGTAEPTTTPEQSKPEQLQPTTNASPRTAQPPKQKPRPAKKPLQDPLAREALMLVGADPEAEAYWYMAINNPSLPANERQDLIEDLNEEGLSDPKHPGPVDLPLLISRIEIIETIGPLAMDQVNTDAFQEAYKDLLNLVDQAMGVGKPVR